MALCSLSTGRMGTLCLAASRVTSSPAMTRISLLATAMSLPARMAASAGREARRADDGDEHHVGLGHGGEFDEAFGSAVAGGAGGKLAANGVEFRRVVKRDGAAA